MKKVFALFMAVFFASTSPVLAASALTDSELDSIDAGEYVVLTDSEGNETAQDVFFSSNSLLIIDEAQKDIQGVSNANGVDSAIAVQTNTSSVEGNEPINNDINQSNTANVANYNPADFNKTWNDAKTVTSASTAASNAASASSASNDSWTAWDKVSAGHTFNYDETLDIDFDAAAAGSSRGSHLSGAEFAAVATLDVDYDKNIDASETYSGEWHETGLWAANAASASSAASSSLITSDTETHNGSETRNNKSEWNALALEDTAQTNIQAVSNLNAVGSATAIQTNIASNVGVAGVITHSNTATVINGL